MTTSLLHTGDRNAIMIYTGCNFEDMYTLYLLIANKILKFYAMHNDIIAFS